MTSLDAMNDHDWDSAFTALFERCLVKYRGGDRRFEDWYDDTDLAYLDSIGYGKREFFDFVEDFACEEDPSPSTALLIASVRRDYLREVMKGEKSSAVLDPAKLPAKSAEVAGIAWLPRLIAKARAKLRGELDADTMFCCGGDRAFFRRHDIAPADFLRAVWASDGDDDFVVDYVRKHQGS